MTSITVLDQQFKDGKPSGFKVELSDGTKGYLVEKDSDKGLLVGDSVNFTAVTPEGKTYKKLTLHKEQGASQPLPSATSNAPLINKPIQQSNTNLSKEIIFREKCLASRDAMKMVVEALKLDNLDFDKTKAKFKEVESALWESIDECCTE